MPSGWPSAIAPPLGLTRGSSSGSPRARSTATPCEAKGLVEFDAVELIDLQTKPAEPLLGGGNGPMPSGARVDLVGHDLCLSARGLRVQGAWSGGGSRTVRRAALLLRLRRLQDEIEFDLNVRPVHPVFCAEIALLDMVNRGDQLIASRVGEIIVQKGIAFDVDLSCQMAMVMRRGEEVNVRRPVSVTADGFEDAFG